MGFDRRPPKVTPPPPVWEPPTTPIGISTWPQGPFDVIVGCSIRLDDDAGTTLVGTPFSATRFAFDLPTTSLGHGATLAVVRRRGTRDDVWRTRITLTGSVDVNVPASAAPLPALASIGQFFQSSTDGANVFVKGASAFALQQVYDRDRGAAEATIEELATIGFNAVRVFSRFRGGLGSYDGNLSTLRALCELCGEYGLYVEVVSSADHTAFKWSVEQEIDWWTAVGNQMRGLPHTFVEGVNEGTHAANTFDFGRLPQLPGVMCSRGSGMSDGGTLEPVFTSSQGYATYHPARKPDFARCVGHNAWEDVANRFNVPTVSNEIMRPDENGYDVQSYFDAGADAALMCAGAYFHHTEGKAAQRIGDSRTRACADAFVHGVNAVDLSLRRGSYTAGNLHDCPIDPAGLPDSSRIHGRINGNRCQVIVTQRPAGWQVRPRNEWRVVDISGNNLVTLQRG